MPDGRSGLRRLSRGMFVTALVLVLAMACTGPESGDDRDPTPTATATATLTPTVPATETPTVAPTETATPTTPAVASPTESASPTTAAASPTATVVPLPERLPLADDMPERAYTIVEDGRRTAEELASAYADSVAHLRRLDEWGFRLHLYRAFTLNNDEENLPYAILATINQYGSDEQAEQALQWLRQLGTATGATVVDAPQLGDSAVALTVPTSNGVPTASVYVRDGAAVFVYFAEGGDPLPAVSAVAEAVFRR